MLAADLIGAATLLQALDQFLIFFRELTQSAGVCYRKPLGLGSPALEPRIDEVDDIVSRCAGSEESCNPLSF